MNTSKFNDPKHRIVASYYGFFAVVGIIYLSYQLFLTPISSVILILYFILLTQLLFMLLGAIKYWKLEVKGLKILYWVSLTLIPIIMTPLVNYFPQVTTGIFLYFHNSYGLTGVGFHFQIAYNTQFTLFNPNWGIGLNIIELILWIRFKRIAAANHISIPPFNHDNLDLKSYT